MEVTISIPASIMRDVEYIPEELLPDIISTVFAESVLSKGAVSVPISSTDEMISEVLSILKSGGMSIAPAIEVVKEAKVEKKEKLKIKVENVAPARPIDDDDDMGELWGLMK